jgi:transposase InsO family protein
VWVVQRFEKFLLGKRFRAFVDHWLHNKELCSISNKRLQGAFAYLRQFQFDLFYRKAKQMQDVDALSRIVGAVSRAAGAAWGVQATHRWETWEEEDDAVPAAPVKKKKKKAVAAETDERGVAQVEMEGVWGFDTKLLDVDALQADDDDVRLIRAIRNGADYTKLDAVPAAFAAINAYKSRDPACDDFVEGQDGRLYHKELINGEMVNQLYVPMEMRGRLVVTKHGSAAGGHRATAETLAKLRKRYYWASMSKDVHEWIAGCGCARKKGEKAKRVGELSGLKLVRPGDKIIFDFLKLPESLSGNKYLLAIVDVGSREIALAALPTKETKGVAKAIMERVYLRGKAPRVWQSDNAKEFTSAVMKDLAELLGAKFKHSSPYHPQTNTHVERYNMTIATQLSLMVERVDQKDWDEHLKFVEYANLVGAQAVLGKISPMFLNGGWEALDPLDRVMSAAREGADDATVQGWMERLAKARTIAMQAQKLAGAESRKRRDVGAVNLDVDVGDKVWVMFPNVRRSREHITEAGIPDARNVRSEGVAARGETSGSVGAQGR